MLKHLHVPYCALFPTIQSLRYLAEYFPVTLETLCISSPKLGEEMIGLLHQIEDNSEHVPSLEDVQLLSNTTWRNYDADYCSREEGIRRREVVLADTSEVRQSLESLEVKVTVWDEWDGEDGEPLTELPSLVI
jgi:hypothetical protein